MPWKGEKDPYKIWLSEIILQQTRVEQGWDYYNRFVRRFPTIQSLAAAPEDRVFKLWEGLGYYSRCRNLIATARYIATERKGVFPDTYEEILDLKGVGPYTAAAIASFAYNLPHAVVDGNVFRVLARVFGLAIPTDSTAGKKQFTQLAQELIPRRRAGEYNQAIMDFGAVLCKPVSPLCTSCPFRNQCKAFQLDKVEEWPVRAKKTAVRKRWFDYLVIEQGGRILVRQRTEKDIWAQLYDFPLLEGHPDTEDNVLIMARKAGWVNPGGFTLQGVSDVREQTLSHQKISARFFEIRLHHPLKAPTGYRWVSQKQMKELALPRLLRSYWTDRR